MSIRIGSVAVSRKIALGMGREHWQHVLENNDPMGWKIAAFRVCGSVGLDKLKFKRIGDIAKTWVN